MGRAVSLGVDLIEFKKAERFYRSHRRRLSGFLNPKEISYIRRHPNPHESLAELLAAKEAVFKALRLPWMGRSEFKDIHIIPEKDERLSFKLAGHLRKTPLERSGARLERFRNEKYVVVKCVQSSSSRSRTENTLFSEHPLY